MRYRRLGSTDLMVSEVHFGLWALSADEQEIVREYEAVRLLQESVDIGVTFFDTADSDSKGYGEELLAKALYSHRHDIIIGTKVGYDFYTPLLDPGRPELPQNFNPKYVRSACERSLRRLRTDYIDLYQLHDPGLETLEWDELWELLEDLVREGKVRYVGIILGSGPEAPEAGQVALAKGLVSTLQLSYNMLQQHSARELFPMAAERKAGMLVRDPHAGGVLTERSLRALSPWGNEEVPPDDVEFPVLAERLKELDFLVQHHPESSLDQLAVAFCLAQPAVASVLPEIRDPEGLQRAVASVGVDGPCTVCQEELYELSGRESARGDSGPDR